MTRLRAILLSAILLLTNGANAEWSMFGKDANHSGVADITERTIQSLTPVASWDRGDGSDSETVHSWGTSIGNFSSNINGEYDRNVSHIVYITLKTDSGDNTRGFLQIRDGGYPGHLMWEYSLGAVEDQEGTDITSDFNNFDSSYGTPAIADYDGDGKMDVAVAKPNGEVLFLEPVITYNSDSEDYTVTSNGASWSLNTGITIVRSNPTIATFDGGNDLVVSGIDIDVNQVVVIAIDGSDASQIWKFSGPSEAETPEISSPVVLDDNGNKKVFVSAYYDSASLGVYGIQGGSLLTGWNPKNIGSIISPTESGHHPLLPSIVISNLTIDEGKEILVPQPPSSSEDNSKLWLFKQDGSYASGWDGGSYTLTNGGDIDSTPAIGDVDGDGDNEIVAVTWIDEGALYDEVTHVWSVHHNRVLDWHEQYDTDSTGGGWDDDEHAISSPILAVIYSDDGSENLDVFTCTTPVCIALNGENGRGTDPDKEFLWKVELKDRENNNRIFNSPAASDVDGDGLLDIVVDASVYSANLADLTLKKSDINFRDSNDDLVYEIAENQVLTLYPITIRNDGNRDATGVTVEVRLDSPIDGKLLHTEELNINSNSVTNLQSFNWTAKGQGAREIWVLCIIDSVKNEEVRYDNNNASKSITIKPQYGLELGAEIVTSVVNVTEKTSFSINLTNMGQEVDNYTVAVTVLKPEWTVDYPVVVTEVVSNTTTSFSVDFTPDQNVTAGVHQFNVTAISEGNNSRNSSILFSISVSQYYSVNLDMPLTQQRVFPGTEVVYPVTITNTGNGDDTFTISTNIAEDWNPVIIPSGSFFIPAFREVDAKLKITSPVDSLPDDNQSIIFTATSQGDTNISESVETNTSVGIMMAETGVVGALPGEIASFAINFLNPSNITDNFSVSILSGDPGWLSETFPYPNTSVAPDGNGTVWLNFTVPNTATIGTKHSMIFGLKNEESELLDQVNVILKVEPIRGVRVWSVDDKFEAYADPDEIVYFDIRVINYEIENLDVGLTYKASEMPGWEVVFDNQSSWLRSLPGESITLVSIGAKAPSNAVAVETFWLMVEALPFGFDKVEFIANITVNQTFGVSIGSKGTTSLLGNVSELVKISVTNTGNGPDIFEISYSGVWAQNGTEFISFDEFETKQISIIIDSGFAPPQTQSTLTVTAVSTKSRDTEVEVSSVEIFSFLVNTVRFLQSQEKIYLGQGESRTLEVAILSLYDPEATASRVITKITGDVYWWLSFDNTVDIEDASNTLIVPVGEPTVHTLSLEIPENAAAGDYEFSVKITDYNEPLHESTTIITIHVIQNFEIIIDTINPPSNVDPDVPLEWKISVENKGNGLDTILLSLDGLPLGWSSDFHSNSELNLNSSQSEVIILTITMPTNTLSGNYSFNVKSQSDGYPYGEHKFESLQLNITVNPVYSLIAEATSEIELSAQPGETVYFQFDVTNLGNSDDSIDVSGSGDLFSQVTTDFKWSLQLLGHSNTSKNYLKATIPEGASGSWKGYVSVSSLGNPSVTTSLEFRLNSAKLPDASLKDLILTPSNPKSGDKVIATFSIQASPDAPIDTIYYNVYMDGKIIGGERVFGIEAGGFKPISFTFEATEGEHIFSVKLDVNNEVVETDVTNNEIQQSFVVGKAGNNMLPIYLAIFAILSVSATVYYRYKNRSTPPIINTKMSPIIEEEDVEFPLILNCLQCSSRVRVAKAGSFRCPSCQTVTAIDERGKFMDIENQPSDLVSEETDTSSSLRRGRMEKFLSVSEDIETENEEIESEIEESEEKLSASEKLEQLKMEEETGAMPNTEADSIVAPQETKGDDEAENKETKVKKKRKGPPKGGSFGPTVGGF